MFPFTFGGFYCPGSGWIGKILVLPPLSRSAPTLVCLFVCFNPQPFFERLLHLRPRKQAPTGIREMVVSGNTLFILEQVS
jgi:hypothetical protein